MDPKDDEGCIAYVHHACEIRAAMPMEFINQILEPKFRSEEKPCAFSSRKRCVCLCVCVNIHFYSYDGDARYMPGEAGDVVWTYVLCVAKSLCASIYDVHMVYQRASRG